ncbi:hypothetical protein ZOSMA_218G00190 [Zostera marina]|uniref:Uncharacterized protein n=1 Tax=Zostera marina TaxID=29655 RepID=A0A0K9PM38_ZOSMR|nr:hypothetical protein ZOSMA_218G00190 [Zostera marina]
MSFGYWDPDERLQLYFITLLTKSLSCYLHQVWKSGIKIDFFSTKNKKVGRPGSAPFRVPVADIYKVMYICICI